MPNTNGHGPKRAILYARVSTQEQATKGYSIRQQLERGRRWCAEEGYEILAEIVDAGQSGATLERPGLDEIREKVAAKDPRVDLVWAQDRDRFAREPAYLYLLKEEFGLHGCGMRSANHRGEGSPEGELTDGILDQLAKYERLKTAERTRRGRLQKARKGKLIRNGRAHYGFKYDEAGDHYLVNEEEMAVVRRIFRLISSGSSLHSIKRTLEMDDIPPSGERL
jgi:site-specific DNA recombinase